MPTYCNGCDYPLLPEDTVVDPLTRDEAAQCPKCGWRSDEPTTRGRVGDIELLPGDEVVDAGGVQVVVRTIPMSNGPSVTMYLTPNDELP